MWEFTIAVEPAARHLFEGDRGYIPPDPRATDNCYESILRLLRSMASRVRHAVLRACGEFSSRGLRGMLSFGFGCGICLKTCRSEYVGR